MTFVEFLVPLRGAGQRTLVLATLFYLRHYRDQGDATTAEVRDALRQARIPGVVNWNLARALHDAGEHVDRRPGMRWSLTDTGEAYCAGTLGLSSGKPENTVAHDVSVLSSVGAKITNDDVRAYVDEAITCLQASALRAAVVFLWTGAIRHLHEAALAKGVQPLNAALLKQDPKSRTVKNVDGFAYIEDRTFLDATPDIGILDKGQKDTLVEALSLRNRCGHPTKYRPGENKTKSFIEDVLGVVFT